MDEKLRKTLRIVIILILVLVNIVVLLSNLIKNKTQNEKNTDNNAVSNQVSENEIYEKTIENTAVSVENKISNMNESDRIKSYFGEFLDNIENKEYNKAYNLLNEEFKNNYFPSLEEFENYINETFPEVSLAAQYNSFNRKGEIYVLNVSIYSLAGSKENSITKDVVIRENGTNNFTISFSK